MKTLIVSVLFLFIFGGPAQTRANPFMSPPPQGPAVQKESPAQNPFLHNINMLQKQYREKMTVLGTRLKTSPSPRLWMTLLGISLLYGILHAAGPGHGKIIAASYFLNSPARPSQALVYGINFAVLHSFSAMVLIIAIHLILKIPLLSSLSGAGETAALFSYALILCIGVWLFIKALKKRPELEPGPRTSGLFLISAVSGMVPCPGATLILAFSISIDSMGFGILSVLSMTLGMMMTVSLISLAVILGKNTFLSPFSRHRSAYMAAQKCFSLGGAVLMMAFSSAFLLGSLL
jgi:ABC-type nickel/cobalt efflux system permease component RcnA